MKAQAAVKTKATRPRRRQPPFRPNHPDAWVQWLAQLEAQHIDPATILTRLTEAEPAAQSLVDMDWSPGSEERAEASEPVAPDLSLAAPLPDAPPATVTVSEFSREHSPSLTLGNSGTDYQDSQLQNHPVIQDDLADPLLPVDWAPPTPPTSPPPSPSLPLAAPLPPGWAPPTRQEPAIPDISLEATNLLQLHPQNPQVYEDSGFDYQKSPLQDNLPVEVPQEIPAQAVEPTEETAEFLAKSWFQSKSQASDSPEPPGSSRGLHTSPGSVPFKPLLESRLGQSLSTLQVFAGTAEVRAILAQFQAIAAHYNGQLLFAEAQPSLKTVTHEVIHALQTRSGNTINNKPVPIQSSTAAEQEATNLAAVIDQSVQPQVNTGLPWAVISVRASLSADAIACLRDAPPATASPAASPESIFETITNSYDLSPISDSNGLTPVRALASSSEPAETESALEADITPPQINVLEEVPTLEPPAPLEPGITPENVTAREASRATAEAKLANAKDVDKKVDAYAAAPPSVKAQSYGSLGSDLSALTQAESESFQEKIPEFQAKLSGETESLPKLQVESPPAEAVTLENIPAPAPEPDIFPTPKATPYTGNNSILRTIAHLSEGTAPQDRANEIGNTLRNVRTTDPEVETTPGPPPAIPLEEETDPERISHQIEAGKELATQARDQAQQAVINGPGPEQVQPVVMDESVPLEELAQMELTQPAPVPGVDEFSQREMPPEVITAFDQNNQDTMQASLAEAQAQVQQTTDERDLNRQEQLDTAQAEADRQTEQADQDQRDAVQTQRERIQDERQHTLEEQTQAVRNVESQTEARRREDQEAIEGRVRQDEDTIRENYNQAERNAAAEVRDGERQAEDKRREAEQKAKNQSWWDRAVNFVQRAFEALTSAIGAIFDAVRSAVNAILNAVKAAAEALIEAAANFIKNAISLFGDFLKGLVDGLLGDLFPGLAAALNSFIDDAVQLALQAVNAVAETLRNGIKALVEGLRAGLNAVLNALQTGLEFAANLIQTALSGDWGAVIRLLLEAVLKVVGIEPETFYGFIGRAEDMFKRILDNPGAVVSNLLKAVTQGIQSFADNFSTHLQRGIIGWLAGTLGSNLQIPTDFSLLGVLDLARQIMGLTLQFIRRIAVRLIGEENVERIEAIFEYVQTLITGGWSALFEQITESLGNVRDMVMEQIKEFLVTRLILAAITKLATLFNPIGAIVQLVLTIWNIFTFLRENLQRLIQIVQTIVDSLSQIVQGVIGEAANSIETVLANLLPVAISFLANLLGIGGIANRVRRIIDGLRDRIENAIVNFIRRIASRFTGRGRGSETSHSPESTEEEGSEETSDSVANIHIDFDIGTEDHEINNQENSYELIMSSSTPTRLSSHADQTVRNAYVTYLREISQASTPGQKRRVANRNLRIIVARIRSAGSQDNPGASAPGIGTIAAHRNQQSRLSRSNIPVWIMESEHIIPRAFVDSAFQALAQVGVPAGRADYQNMHTILIYKRAADLKTEGSSGDTSRINDFKATVRKILEVVLKTPQKDPSRARDEMAAVILRLLAAFANEAKARTNKAIRRENQEHREARGPQGNPEPPTPTPSAVNRAYEAQREDINNQLSQRIKTFLQERQSSPP